MNDLLSRLFAYTCKSIILILFIAGSVFVLDDIRKRLYKTNICYSKIKKKILPVFLKSNEDQGFKIEVSLIDRVKDDFREIFCRSPYRITIYSFVLITLFLYYQNKDMFSQTSVIYFAIILVFTLIDFLTKYSIFLVTKGFFNNFILNSLYAVIYFLMFASLCYVSMIMLIGQGKSINFISVLIILLIILIPFSRFATECINVQKRNFNLAIIILILFVFEMIMYLIFGTYNISLDERYLNVNTDQIWLGTLQIIQAGTEHIFNYPELPTRIEYTIQYLIGFFIHVIMFGFYISIVSSKILEINKSRVNIRFLKNLNNPKIKLHTNGNNLQAICKLERNKLIKRFNVTK